jgi:hypothetical protein
MEVSGLVHPSTTLIQGKQPQYTLGGRLDGTQSRPGPSGKESRCPFIQGTVITLETTQLFPLAYY